MALQFFNFFFFFWHEKGVWAKLDSLQATDSLVLLWAAAEIGVVRPHPEKPLCRTSHFTSTLMSLFCLSTCIPIPSPQRALMPAATCWWHGGGCGAQGAAGNVCGTQQVTSALQVQPPPMAHEGGLVMWPSFAHYMTTCLSWQKLCLQDKNTGQREGCWTPLLKKGRRMCLILDQRKWLGAAGKGLDWMTL